MSTKIQSPTNPIVKAAFGAKNRNRLIEEYLRENATDKLAPDNAWKHVYRLLLWADPNNGLAHCYESDKSQPGKNWYSRSLAFHEWTANALNSTPAKLAEEIDWLFLRASSDLAAAVLQSASKIRKRAESQRAPFAGKGFPEPGVDPELVHIIRDVIGDHFETEPSNEKWHLLVQRIRQYLSLQNKRKNLVGEGFEDVLTHIVQRVTGLPPDQVRARQSLHDVPGFANARKGDKPNKVDLVILRPQIRTLVTAKWSLRADRERQFPAEFGEYVRSESASMPWEYVFVTNEFDPARLMRACEQLAGHNFLFARVVHINTDAIGATYGNSTEDSMRRVLKHIDSGRLVSLSTWLRLLAPP